MQDDFATPPPPPPKTMSPRVYLLVANFLNLFFSLLLVGLVSKNLDSGRSFWWESPILAFALATSVLAILGISSFCWKQVLAIYLFLVGATTYVVLFLSVGTFAFNDVVQHYIAHNWDGLQMYFPEFQNLNSTNAIIAAQDYVGSQTMAIGSVSLVLFLFLSCSLVFATMVMTLRVVATRLLTLVNLFFCMIGIAVCSFGGYLLRHPDSYGASIGIPIAFLTLGAFLILLSFGGICGAYLKKNRWLHTYIWVVSVLLLLVLAGTFSGWRYHEQLRGDLQALSGQEFSVAVAKMGLDSRTWTRSDFDFLMAVNFRLMALVALFVMLALAGAIALAAMYLKLHLAGYASQWQRRRDHEYLGSSRKGLVQ